MTAEPREVPPGDSTQDESTACDPAYDQVVFGPARDSRAFLVGLWMTAVALSAATISGWVLRDHVGDAGRVLTSVVTLLWLVANYAIGERGKLLPMPRLRRKISALVACVVFAAWCVVAAVAAGAPGSMSTDALGQQIALIAVGVVVYTLWLWLSHRARSYRWRADRVPPSRGSLNG